MALQPVALPSHIPRLSRLVANRVRILASRISDLDLHLHLHLHRVNRMIHLLICVVGRGRCITWSTHF